MSQKANSDKKQKAEELDSIENLSSRLQITTSILEGVKAYKGWSLGKKVTESEFRKSVEMFLGSPIDKVVRK